jgi:hypothetical protein
MRAVSRLAFGWCEHRTAQVRRWSAGSRSRQRHSDAAGRALLGSQCQGRRTGLHWRRCGLSDRLGTLGGLWVPLGKRNLLASPCNTTASRPKNSGGEFDPRSAHHRLDTYPPLGRRAFHVQVGTRDHSPLHDDQHAVDGKGSGAAPRGGPTRVRGCAHLTLHLPPICTTTRGPTHGLIPRPHHVPVHHYRHAVSCMSDPSCTTPLHHAPHCPYPS